jgi:acyl phosphate:glycerol-3-phosphate acyltransferase
LRFVFQAGLHILDYGVKRTMMWDRLLLAAAVGYLFGAIPVGYLVIYFMKGKDIRLQGSGRTGGTNALRAGGTWAGILTGAGDILKGFLAVMVARSIAGPTPAVEAIAGIAAVVGHNWSIFMGFKGGAGTTPNIGACIAMWPLSGLWLVPMLLLGLDVFGYASVTSLVVAAIIPLTLAVHAATGNGPWLYVAYGIVTASTVVWALRPNIKRLLKGTEPRAPRLLFR